MDADLVLRGVLAALVCAVGAWAGARGGRLLRDGLRADDAEAPLRLVRGLRGLIVMTCAAAAAAGLLSGQGWLLIFAGLWLAEEIWETGVLALILRAGARAGAAPTAAREVRTPASP